MLAKIIVTGSCDDELEPALRLAEAVYIEMIERTEPVQDDTDALT